MSGVEDLFGSDDEGELEPKAPAPKPTGNADKRSKLQALIAAKRKEAEEQKEQQRKPKKQKAAARQAVVDFGEDDDEDEEGGAQLGGRGGGSEDEDEEGGATGAGGGGSRRRQQQQQREGAREAPLAELDEVEEAGQLPTEADLDFIDDDGLAPDERIDFGDDEEQLAGFAEAEEAGEGEEEDELERMFSKRKKKEGMSEGEAKAVVEGLLAMMEVAVEEDHKQYEQGRPAVHKLRLLSRVEDVLSTKRLHNELLDAGLLGVLKAWIEPMPDGALPNAKIRETVLRLLHQLPVDCSLEDRKEQLKRSGLGKVVMFLFKVPDETPGNRKLAKELVERWSRPILAPNRVRGLDDEEQERILAARQQRQARLAAKKAAERGDEPEEDEDGMRRRQPKFGEPGFRFHAAIPQAAQLDYVKAPTGQYAMPEKKKVGSGKDKGGAAGEHKLTKKLKGMAAKGGRPGRAAVVSVEGRNVTIQH